MEPNEFQWRLYYLHYKDHCNRPIEQVAEEMGISTIWAKAILDNMKERWPELFKDISGDRRRLDNGVEQYYPNYDDQVKRKFLEIGG